MTKYYQYLIEIKNRTILLFITGITVSLTSYHYKVVLFFTLGLKPSFFITSNDLVDFFSVSTKLTVLLTSHTILTYFFYHCFVFLKTGLYDTEKKFFKIFFCLNLLITILSILCVNTILFSTSFDFFITIHETFSETSQIYTEIRVEKIFKLYINLYYSCYVCGHFFFLGFLVFYSHLKFLNLNDYKKLVYFLICYISFPDEISGGLLVDFFLVIFFYKVFYLYYYFFSLKKI